MKTVPLTKSDLLMHFKETLALIENGTCEAGTISWEKTPLGTYEVIAVALTETGEGIIPLTIGDVNG